MTTYFAQRSFAGELYARELSNAYRSFRELYDPDYALQQDLEAYEILRRDPGLWHALERREHLVAAFRWHVKPASDREEDKALAAVLEALLGKIRRFAECRRMLARADLEGAAWCAIRGEWRELRLGDYPRMRWWVPTQLKHAHKLRFKLLPRGHGQPGGEESPLNPEWHVWSIERQRWEPLGAQRCWWIRHVVNDTEQRLGHGWGLAECLYFFQAAKIRVLKEGLGGLERWARGMLIQEIEGLRVGSQTNDALANQVLDQLEKFQGRHVGVIQAGSKIHKIEGGAEGHQQVVSFYELLEKRQIQAILGNYLSTGGGSEVGSLARAETEKDAGDELIAGSQGNLAESIDADLVESVWRFNRVPLDRVGLGDAERGTYEVPEDDIGGNPEMWARVVATARVPLKRDEVYDRLGFTPPAEGDEVIEPAAAPLAQPALGGFSASMPPAAAPGRAPFDPSLPFARGA